MIKDHAAEKNLPFLKYLFCLMAIVMWTSSVSVAKYKKIDMKIQQPSLYPSHMTQEDLTIAADPYWNEGKIGQVFEWKDMLKRGILPILVIIENDGLHAVSIRGNSIQLLAQGNEIFEALSGEYILSLLYAKSPRRSPPVSLPIPLPKQSGLSSAARQEILDDLEKNSLLQCLIEPHQTRSGFVFFHLPREAAQENGLRLYIPDISDASSNKPRLFFEIAVK